MKKRTRILGLRVPMLALAAVAGLIALMAFLQPTPASADLPKFYLDCPTTEVREGESFEVFLVWDHSDGGWSYWAWWHTDAGTADSSDFTPLPGEGRGTVGSNAAENTAKRQARAVYTTEDTNVEGNETFTVRFTPVDSVVDRNNPDRDEKCEITIIDDDPNITDISLISDPARDGTYGVGETIEIEATFSTRVDVDGDPSLGLQVGSNWQSASYLRGSGTNKLVFGYTVRSADRDSNGIGMDGGYQDSNGRWHNLINHTAITAAGTETVAYRVYAGIDDQSGHKVDGSLAPVITGIGIISTPARDSTYGFGETIEIEATFSTRVDVVDENIAVSLWLGDSNGGEGSVLRSAFYQSGSGTDTLHFSYQVRLGDVDNNGIHIGAKSVTGLGAGRIKVAGTDVDASHFFLGVNTDQRVDGSSIRAISTKITSSPDSGDTYRYGESIDFSITFSAPLEVEGSRHLSLRVGSDDNSAWRGANYKSGSGTNTLTFGYTVQSADLDTDGASMLGTWTEDGILHGLGGSGTIKVKGTDTVVTPTFNGLSNQSGHKVNGQPYPKTISITSTPISRSDTYGRDEVIQVSVNFDQNVDAGEGAIAILRIGSVWRQGHAQYASGSGTDTLVFEYTVLERHMDSNGVDAFLPHGLDIKAAGTEVAYQPNPGGVTLSMGEDSKHKVDGSLVTVDTTAPTVSSISFVALPGPGDDETYGAGDWVAVHVTFSESVLVTGAPQIELNIGDAARQAEYGHGPGGLTVDPTAQSIAYPTVVFGYTVQESDVDSDGISIGANKITLNGGTIKDEADNNVTLTHDAVAADSGHKVEGTDETAPTVSSVAITSDPQSDHTYRAGDTIQITVTFSENMVVTGAPQLEMNMYGSNPAARQASYSSTSGAVVVFTYSVEAGDLASDGLDIEANKLTLNEGTIQDEAGNDAVLTHSALTADPDHFVDGRDTTAPTVSSVAITSDPGSDHTYRTGDTIQITVTFSEDVVVTGAPQLELNMYNSDPAARQASYSSTSGAGVVFAYTVADGDRASDGLDIEANKLTLNEGTIQDEAGNDAVLTHSTPSGDTVRYHYVDARDATAPTVSSVAITSDPGSDYTYRSGDTIQITVTFSEDVVVTGAPQLELNMYESNPAARQASYSSTSGAVVVFTYTVAAGDRASDGLDIEANKLTLNEGTIQDASGNDATLTHSALSADPDHFVRGAGGV